MQIEQRIEGMEIKLRQIVKGGNNEKCKEIRNCSDYRTYFNGTHCNFSFLQVKKSFHSMWFGFYALVYLLLLRVNWNITQEEKAFHG